MLLNQRISQSISIAFHPFFIPTLCTATIFYFGQTILPISTKQFLLLLGLVFTFTVLLPSISIYTLYNSRFISNLTLSEKKDRITSLIVATVYYTMLTYLVIDKLGIDLIISEIIAGMAISVTLVTLLTPFLTISVHAAGMSALLGILLGLQYTYNELELLYPILLTIFLAGWVMSARLNINYYPPSRLLTGSLIGFTVCFFTVTYLAQ